MGVVRVKPGVQFTVIAPAGFRILRAIDFCADRLGLELMITCGTEAHPLADPHTLGEAYDLRTHGLGDDNLFNLLALLRGVLADDHFFVLHESVGTPNEHIHIQRKRGTVFPPVYQVSA